MKGIICWFIPHKWSHVLNVNIKTGLWQCPNCKEISIGRAVIEESSNIETLPKTVRHGHF